MKRPAGTTQGGGEEWPFELKRLCETIVPLKRRPALQQAALLVPSIVNVVATATLLPPGYTLPMKAIARTLKCCQYAPRMFAAIIVKLADTISACTALIFSTGCVVVVSLRSENHASYICQTLRLLLETVHCVLRDERGMLLDSRTLEGRLHFDRCEIHNIVGKADLAYRIDLQAMAEAAPSSCKWFKDSFPGLECKIWLTASYTCVCGRPAGSKATAIAAFEGPGQRKCSCAVKLLIFPTGRLVITGARRLQDVNAVFFRVKALAPLYEARPAGPAPQPSAPDDFYQDFAQNVLPAPPEATASVGIAHARTKKQLKPDVAIACIMAGVSMLQPTPKEGTAAAPAAADAPPFMQMALAGRVDVVRGLYLMDPDAAEERDAQGRTTLQRLRSIPAGELTTEQKQIMEMLHEVTGMGA
jgi:TATA-box binding protein (TBP) (component of TFIID and TFIIIB)